MKVMTVRVLYTMILIFSGHALAQNAETGTESVNEEDVLEEVVTIGSRVKGRSVIESTVPVDVLPIAELQKTPSADLKDAIEAVSPSYYVHRESASDQDTFSRETNLRGLDGGEVLLLVNGKRVHRSAVVNKIGIQQPNVSTFSSNSMSRIEILRDGASALYGADAVAGVINLVMDSSEGISAHAGYSTYYEGDGALYTVGGKFGSRFLNDEGFFTLSAEYSSQDPTQRNLPHLAAVTMVADAERRGVPIDVDPNSVQPGGISSIDTTVVTWNAAVPITEAIEFYSFGNFAYISNTQPFNYRENLYCTGGPHQHPGLRPCSEIPERYPNGAVGTSPAPMSPTLLTLAELSELIGPVAAENAAYLLADGPNGTSVNGATPVGFDPKVAWPNGYTPYFEIEGPDVGVYSGIRGELSNNLTWDLGGTFGRSRVDYHSRDTFNPSMGAPMAPDGSINYAAMQTNFYVGGLVNWEAAATADFTYLVDTNAVDTLQISFGGTHRWEHYYNIVGEENSWKVGPLVDLSVGSNGFAGIAPVTQFETSRTNYGLYIDFDAQVNERLNLTAAARYEDYSDFGDNLSAKVSGRFELVPDMLAVRAAVSTGFHAPSLGQIDNLQLTSRFLAGEINFGGIFPASHPLSIALGAAPLEAETAQNLSFGFVWFLGDKTNLTIDAFQIKLDDRIRLSQIFRPSTPAYAPAFEALIASGFPGAAFLTEARYFGNSMDTTTEGIELVGTHVFDFTNSQLALTLAYAHVKTEVTDSHPVISNQLANLQTELFSPPHRGVLTANYFLNDFDFSARVRWWGSQEMAFGFTNPDGSFRVDENPDVAYFDLSGAYRINDTMRITVGLDNVFDTYPDSIPGVIDPTQRSGRQYFVEGPPWQGGSYYARFDVSF